ncbi:hypothetical protein ACFL6U_11305 [Planctomycetota bacterium]
MNKKPTTFGMYSQKISDLLKVGTDELQNPLAEEQDQKKADLLHDILNATLPVCFEDENGLSGESAGWQRTVEVLSGDSVGELLQDPETDLSFVRTIKDHGRRVSSSTASEVEHEVGNTVYFAAIASALIFHSVRISRLSYVDLKKSFHRLTSEDWIPQWLIELFGQACDISTKKSG